MEQPRPALTGATTTTAASGLASERRYPAPPPLPPRAKPARQPMNTGTKIMLTGVKTLLGIGVGVLAGTAAVVACAQTLEIAIPALFITKVTGVVGGAAGLLKGVNDAHKC